MLSPLVSIVIPVLDDSVELASLLGSLEPRPAFEAIVVDGDPTEKPAMRQLQSRFAWVRWITSGPGRGRQMNEGARHAQGRWLMFLHADTRLASGWLDEIRRADESQDAVGGSFRFVLGSTDPRARAIEWGVRHRVRWLDLPFGDQALFVRRSAFEALGGYRELPLMEDVDLVRRLRRVGPLMHSDLAAVTSARQWERDGWLRRSATNSLLVALFHLGVPPESLARLYGSRR